MEISSAITQAISIIEKSFAGNDVNIVSEMYRLAPDKYSPAGQLGCDIVITPMIEGCTSTKVFFPNYIAEDIAWSPMGQLIANEFVWGCVSEAVRPFMD